MSLRRKMLTAGAVYTIHLVISIAMLFVFKGHEYSDKIFDYGYFIPLFIIALVVGLIWRKDLKFNRYQVFWVIGSFVLYLNAELIILF
ncbi:MAG: hypothetical protein JEZ08_25255 [Clostridiales bacterium]|nr:hypothetical protein [Clostridiales bacterium]